MDMITVHNTGAICERNIFSQDIHDRFFAFIDASDETAKAYRNAIKQFVGYLSGQGISEPTREDIISFREHLKGYAKPTTVQNYIVAVKVFFRFLDSTGVYKNIADKVKGAKLSRDHKKDYLTSSQCKQLLTGIDQTTTTGARDYAIVCLLLTTGLRTVEIARANLEDLRTVGDATALYIQGKGRTDRTEYVKLAEPVEKAIRAYLASQPEKKESDPLFTSTSNNNRSGRLTTRSISGTVKHHLVKSGLNSSRLTAHSLRHTAGTLNLLNGATLEETQQLLRHRSINTTMIYAHHIDRAKNNSESRIASVLF